MTVYACRCEVSGQHCNRHTLKSTIFEQISLILVEALLNFSPSYVAILDPIRAMLLVPLFVFIHPQPDQFLSIVISIGSSNDGVSMELCGLAVGQKDAAVEVKLDDVDGRMDPVVVGVVVTETSKPDKVGCDDCISMPTLVIRSVPHKREKETYYRQCIPRITWRSSNGFHRSDGRWSPCI